MDGKQIVIVEDEATSRLAMEKALKKKNYNVISFEDSIKALDYIKTNASYIDLVITDFRMPGMNGLELIGEVTKLQFDISIILVTAFGSIESAVEAMKLGADDYLAKPIDMFELRKRVEKIINNKRLKREVDNLKQRIDKFYSFSNIIGKSPEMKRLFEKILTVAPTDVTVLITGESGTGKELIANAIHQNSPRKNNLFLPINCAAIPGEILESELFGHEKGAFTGAVSQKMGKFELASNGTLFLDEIGEMSLDLQAKLLRIIEQKEFMRVGGNKLIKVKTRIIAATNQNLEELVKSGKFREDLYFRLKVVHLKIPPLRERKGDIPLLVNHFIKKFGETHNKEGVSISPDALKILEHYPWPGNVRELQNLIESLIIFSNGDIIEPQHLPEEIIEKSTYKTEIKQQHIPDLEDSVIIKLGEPLEEIEKRVILKTLRKFKGNKTHTAKALGIGLRTLHRKLKEYGEEG
ncbi:two-component system, NtrC family, response regulator [Thermotomaculum hydrothermale]|uniref:Two-component system, NtrC family, response regulator n=1 Tax=Thermotomaculum hydrothermale TaxID=981385 RepID=A0A7R6PY52_9BACT|nr:sigma-54 dependent transcriptional regulator [Thermotomaculum hydrothermale]BBB32960.1 two-component system, NtrC family, response regulator [Thermotomaculum hydrothermale]